MKCICGYEYNISKDFNLGDKPFIAIKGFTFETGYIAFKRVDINESILLYACPTCNIIQAGI